MRMQRTLRLAAALMVLFPAIGCISSGKQLAAKQQAWTNLGLGGGGGIFCPVSSPHDPTLMFCTSDMSGVYRSTDSGRTWRMLPYDQISGAITDSIAFHPTDPNVLYCLPGGYGSPQLHVSRDKGITWQIVTKETPWLGQSPSAPRFAIDPTGVVLMVCSEKGALAQRRSGQDLGKGPGHR